MRRRTFLQLAAAAPALAQPAKSPASKSAPAGTPWTQWGGPNRNFQTDAAGIKDKWPAGGPKVIWKRPLGDGYSCPSVEGNVLYTMYGKPDIEVVMAADATTGKTLWEQSNPMTFKSSYAEPGNGPYSAPLIVGDRLFTTGVAGRFQCFDKKTGKLLWTQQLWTEHKGSRLDYGYSSSPIAFRDLVIVPVGGQGRALMAFKQADGSVAWSKNDFGNAYSSPLLINVDGLEQLAMLMDGYIIAVNPHNGDLQWRVPFKASYGIAVATPVWCPGNLLFVSAEYDAGAKMIQLARNNLQTTATELWTSNRLRLHHGNAILVKDTLYFTSGGKTAVSVFSAVDAKTGKIHWQERNPGKVSFVLADQKLISVGEDGALLLIRPSPEKLDVIAKADNFLSAISWTPPVLVGTRLYIRDRKDMMAVDLG